MKKNRLLFYLGNALIIFSLLSTGYILYPIIRLSLFPSTAQAVPDSVFSVSIPRINATAPIIEQVDPWNEQVYKEELKKGVAHAKGSAFPGENGRVFLFAHSSALPWEITRFNTAFFRLTELQTGDTIILKRNGKKYIYSVYMKKEVWPDEVSYLRSSSKNAEVVLQTCTPIGTTLKRLLIFARQEEVTAL